MTGQTSVAKGAKDDVVKGFVDVAQGSKKGVLDEALSVTKGKGDGLHWFGSKVSYTKSTEDLLKKESPLGDKVAIAYSNTTTAGTQGIIGTSKVTYAEDGTVASVSITVFGFTFKEGQNNAEISYGMFVNRYGGSAGISLNGFSTSITTPNNDQNANTLTGTFRPGVGATAVALVALFAPEALPSIIFGGTQYAF
jgi:hypothetical protein